MKNYESIFYKNSFTIIDFPTPEFPVIRVLIPFCIKISIRKLYFTDSAVGTNMLKKDMFALKLN